MTDDDGWIGGWHTRARARACMYIRRLYASDIEWCGVRLDSI